MNKEYTWQKARFGQDWNPSESLEPLESKWTTILPEWPPAGPLRVSSINIPLAQDKYQNLYVTAKQQPFPYLFDPVNRPFHALRVQSSDIPEHKIDSAHHIIYHHDKKVSVESFRAFLA
jgi:hypothetical protein